MHRLNEQLTRLSTTDALTEVGNRRMFDQTLKTEWARAARRGEPVGLLMIDIDHFKEYNDHYGHPAGDACLRQVARMVGQSMRRGGELVARYGGEEFALLLPGADLEDTRRAAERCAPDRRRREDRAPRLGHLGLADDLDRRRQPGRGGRNRRLGAGGDRRCGALSRQALRPGADRVLSRGARRRPGRRLHQGSVPQLAAAS